MILSENDLEHAMLALAALYVGVPFVAVSPAYSLVSRDFGKLRYVAELMTPGCLRFEPRALRPCSRRGLSPEHGDRRLGGSGVG